VAAPLDTARTVIGPPEVRRDGGALASGVLPDHGEPPGRYPGATEVAANGGGAMSM